MRTRRQTCKRKVKHLTEREAYTALRKLRNEEYCEKPRSLNVYRCGDHWHVGHRSARMVK